MQILIVDDDPLAAEMAAAILEDAGHQTLTAENGMEAMETLNAHGEVGLIISDMNMPLVSGLELFSELRGQGQTQPFILLTGDDPAPYLAQAPELDGCLVKDDNLFENLISMVERVVAK